jgi:four helix bundle protein
MPPRYDLEERGYRFAKECRDFTHMLPRGIANNEYIKQLIRSSGSQIANYIEANESLGRKDFLRQIRICIKEAKESGLWLGLCEIENNRLAEEKKSYLIKEARELRKIFAAILIKSK